MKWEANGSMSTDTVGQPTGIENMANEGDSMSIAVMVGAGMMGSAMCTPLSDRGHEVRLVGTPLDREIISSVQASGYHPTLQRQLPQGVKAYQVDALADALVGADLVLGGVSSFGVQWFRETVLPHLAKRDLPVLLVTKGLAEQETGQLETGQLEPIPWALQAALPSSSGSTISAIGGPCIARELTERRQTTVAFCGDDLAVLGHLRDLLATPYYHISLSTDVRGVETAVAMKNAYAMGVSLAIGLIHRENGGDGPEAYNPQAALFGQSTREIQRLVQVMEGRPESAVFGIADLYVTVFGGRTRRLGILLGSGLSFAEASQELAGVTLESVAIATKMAAAVRRWDAENRVKMAEFPLLMHMDGIINAGQEVAIPWTSFITALD